MSRSRKKEPVCYNAGGLGSQKWGKQTSSRIFRKREHQALAAGEEERAPRRQREVMPAWKLGCEGHQYCGNSSKELQEQVKRK